MRLTRVYYPNELNIGSEVQLDATASRHLLRVLRLKPNASFIVFNGQGGEYQAVISKCHKMSATATIQAFLKRDVESKLNIHLAQALCRSEKMDWVLQKAVELGVNQLTPLITKHSEVKLTADKAAKKIKHWEGVIISACEQSGRTKIPAINQPIVFEHWVNNRDGQSCFLLEPNAQKKFSDFHNPSTTMTLIVGPEGGFSDAEIALAKQREYRFVSLGLRTLRTETAGLAAIAAIQALWGDL